MNSDRMAGYAALLLAAMFFMTGCEDDSGPAPVGADIGGNWSGYYTRPGRRIDLTATIDQHGSNIVIQTSLPTEGHLLSGIIREDAFVSVKDQYTGEIWTSWGEVTSEHLMIRDYLVSGTNTDWPEQRIYLSR